jgi:hypothetical protein
MRIAETCCVFEPVTECAVSPDMDEPNRAASGQVAAEPTITLMKSRRRIAFPKA